MNSQNKLKYSDIATNIGHQLIDNLGDFAEAGLDSASFSNKIDSKPL
jgi:hypothetical protein